MKRLIALTTLATIASMSANAQDASPPAMDKTPPAASDTAVPSVKPDIKAPAEVIVPKTEKSVQLPSSSTVGKMTLTEDEANNWIGKVVYSSDNSNLGEVSAFKLGANKEVTGLQADIGGFLGIGETKMDFDASQFSMKDDSIILNMTKAEVQALQNAKN